MIRLLTWWICMGIVIPAFSQVITVTDQSTWEPLGFASIQSENPGTLVVADSNGQADISTLKGADSIFISMTGYEPVRLSYGQLNRQGFKVQLTRSTVLLDELVVSSYKDDEIRQTSLHIGPLPLSQMTQQGSFTLSDALSKVPGISQLSSGIGISKPVIRGLYGNRILVLLSGLRFDNQQWQDEHGLGLSDVGISRIEIIKGPMSLLYGTEAVGGVLNIIEESPPKEGTTESEGKLNLHSNTLGGTIQAAIKSNFGNKWYRVRLAATDHADYSDGNNRRVLNSRFNGYHLKAAYGFQKPGWRSENYYHLSLSNFGFVFSDSENFFYPGSRWSRSMTGPHHIVLLNIFSSVNQFRLRNSMLKLNAGIQSNVRSEDEGGGELSLRMHLLTGQYSLKWSKSLGGRTSVVLANYTSVENNNNFGRRKIVPDAWMTESAVSVYLENQLGNFILEYGLGGGGKYIKTLPTSTVNSEEKDIDPFTQIRPFANGMIGTSFIPTEKWNVKLNLSTGVRAPNLAELSSNGLHEGIYTYELGDPDMKNEQNKNGDLGINYAGDLFRFGLSGFYNHFDEYIYLEPTPGEWFGFPIYKFRQYDATIYGGEAKVEFGPTLGVNASVSYSGLVGKLVNGEYLPYMPAQKIKPEIRYTTEKGGRLTAYCFVNTDLVLAQNLVNPEEDLTPAYELVNAGAGVTYTTAKAACSVGVSGNNLLNEAYYDHLSRFKNFGLLNMGRDISFNLKINFVNNLKKQ